MPGIARKALLLCGIALAPAQIAQTQTGVILRRPGEPLRGPVAIPVPPSKPNLTPPMLASFKGTILLRRESGIFIVRSGDKFARRVLSEVYSASLSPDSHRLVYFSQKQIRLATLAADGSLQTDTVLEELPAAQVEDIGWSADGAMLAYDVHSQTNPGVRVFYLATGGVRRLCSGEELSAFRPMANTCSAPIFTKD